MAIYAIDFDNTLAVTRFLEIIAPNKKMIAFAKTVQAQGHKIILWTSRAGRIWKTPWSGADKAVGQRYKKNLCRLLHRR